MSETADSPREGATLPDASASAASEPASPVALTPYQRRKERERQREERRERARKAREARDAASTPAESAREAGAAAPASTPAQLSPVEREKLVRSTAVFLHLPWWLFSVIAYLLGYSAPKLSPELAAEHAEHWAVYAETSTWFRFLVKWVAAPVLLVRDFVAKLTPRKKKDDPS